MLCNSLLINLNVALKFRGCNFARSCTNVPRHNYFCHVEIKLYTFACANAENYNYLKGNFQENFDKIEYTPLIHINF